MSNSDANQDNMKGILTDVTKCIGCERCVEACVTRNKLPDDLPAKFKADDGLSGNRFTSIVKTPGTERAPGGKRPENDRWVRRQCMHCIEPSCQSACLVGALEKRADGPVVYHADKCIGCRYCMLACPFMIPRYEYDKQLPYVRKCKMNEDCRMPGGMPACTSICPTGATIFGTRKSLIKEAKRRIAENPGKYVNHIYGEHEFGGTSVMYISDVSLSKTLMMPTKDEFEKLAVPSLVDDSIPNLLHKWVLVTPFQFVGVACALTGIWFFRRRSKIMNEKMKVMEQTPTRTAVTDANDAGDPISNEDVKSDEDKE